MTSLFLETLERVFAWLVEASWQASLLAALVLLLQWTFRARLNSRWHHALWLLVIARLLLPALPESALSLYQFAPPPPAFSHSVTEPLFAPDAAPLPDFAINPTPLPEKPAHPLSVYTFLALVWFLGAFALFLITWQVNRRFGRHVRHSPAVTDSTLLQILANAQAQLGLHRSLRLIESPRVQGPAVMGLFHPTLILPLETRARFTDEELRFIFLHELAHLKRGDLILQWLIALLQILHWFNPVLWYAFRRMRADREPATDALVLSRTGEPEKYGHVLLKLLENYHHRHALPTLVGILEDKDQFKRRFLLIARFTRGAYGWSLLGVILFAALTLGGLTKSTAETAKSRSPEDATEGKWVRVQVYAVDLDEKEYQEHRDQIDQAAKDGAYLSIEKLPSSQVLAHSATYSQFGKGGGLLSGPSYPCVLDLTYHPAMDHDKVVLDGALTLATDEWDRRPNPPLLREKPIPGATYPIRLKLTLQVPQAVDPRGIVEPKESLGQNSEGPRRLFVFLSAWPAATKDVPTEYHALLPTSTSANLDASKKDQLEDNRLNDLATSSATTHQIPAPGLNMTGYSESSHTTEPIRGAIGSDDYDAVKSLLDHGNNFDARDVQEALRDGRQRIVALLWSHGPPHYCSELSYAINQDQPVERIADLLKNGASVSPPEDTLITPLGVAAQRGNIPVAKLLLDHGANVNPSDPKLNPLDEAAGVGKRPEMVDFLLQQKARITNQTLIQTLVWSLDADRKPNENSTIIMQELIRAGALKGIPEDESANLLLIAYQKENPALLQQLLDAGLSPRSRFSSPSGPTVLDVIRSQASPSTGDIPNQLLEMLKNAGKSSTTLTPEQKWTVAVDADQPDSAQSLLDSGAKASALDQADALSGARNQIVKLMWDHGAKDCSELTYAISQGATAAQIEAMLQKGAAVQPPEDRYISPLAVAVVNGKTDIAAALLNHGADPNWRGARSTVNPSLDFSALQRAIATRRTDCVSLLLDHGAKIEPTMVSTAVLNCGSDFPKDSAQQSFDIAKILAAHGALELVPDERKGPLFSTACRVAREPALVQLFLDHGYSPNLIGSDLKTPVIEQVRRASEGQDSWPDEPQFKPILALLEAANKHASSELPLGAKQNGSTAVPPTVLKPWVHIGMTILELDDDVYLANKEKIDAGIERDVPGLFSFLTNLRGVTLISTPNATTQPGIKANIDIVREFPYPTSFEPARVSTAYVKSDDRIQGQTALGGKTNIILSVPTTPREFATKDVGISTQITTSFDDESSPNHGKIILNGTLSVVNFDGFTKSNLGPGMPSFTTSETHFLEALDDKQRIALLIPGVRGDEETFTEKDNAGKIVSNKTEAANKRLILFVSASTVK